MPGDSTTIQIADAVVTAINGAALSQSVLAERHYLPEFNLADLDQLRVSVIPAETEQTVADRTRDQTDYTIHVAIQKRVAKQSPPGLDTQAIDALLLLVEEIGDLFRHQSLATTPVARWVKTENRPIYDPKHLNEHGQFTSLLALTFRTWR
jgi:hypothetical protein